MSVYTRTIGKVYSDGLATLRFPGAASAWEPSDYFGPDAGWAGELYGYGIEVALIDGDATAVWAVAQVNEEGNIIWETADQHPVYFLEPDEALAGAAKDAMAAIAHRAAVMAKAWQDAIPEPSDAE